MWTSFWIFRWIPWRWNLVTLKSTSCRSACRISRAASDSPTSTWWCRGPRTTCRRWERQGQRWGWGGANREAGAGRPGWCAVAHCLSHHAEWGHSLSLQLAASFFHAAGCHGAERSQGNKVTLINNYLICEIGAFDLSCTLESSGSL